MNERMSKYTATLEEDRKFLKKGNLSDNEMNCILFRIGEKEIVEFVLESSSFALELMEGNMEKA